jgi:hypothetical protein
MAYEFNGTNQYLSTASAPVTSWPLTMACWFNVANVTTQYVLMCVGKLNDNERFVLQAAGHLAGDPVATNYIESGGTSYRADSTTGFSANTWTHACAVYTSASSRTAYLNAGSGGTNTGSATLSNSGINSVLIGAQSNISFPATSHTSGLIAEVGIWNAALTAAEIASLADGMTCDKVRPQSLVFYAPLVRDLVDVKGGLAITNNNTATVANHPRVYA